MRVRAIGMVVLLSGLVAGGVGQNWDEAAAAPTKKGSSRAAPKNPPPPRSGEGREPGSASSRSTRIDLSPPPGDPGSHPEAPPRTTTTETGDVIEMRPYDPHKAEKNIEVGEYYFKERNYRAAISRFCEALEWKPNDAVATFRLAEAMEKAGHQGYARHYYEAYLKMLREGPYAPAARQALARLPAGTESSQSVPGCGPAPPPSRAPDEEERPRLRRSTSPAGETPR